MPETYMFRAQGLPVETTERELKQMLSKEAGHEVNLCEVDLSVDPGEKYCTAIFGVKGQVPEYFQSLVKGTGRRDPITFKHCKSVVTVDADFYGFTQLYPPKKPILADIIAISGINGHAYGSWTARSGCTTMWLRDFFREDFPECRVMIYGYNANLRSNGLHTMLEYKRQLLTRIRDVRQGDVNTRPLIFICHSYGGLVVAQSLVEAKFQHSDPYYRDLIKAIYGIFFFGTPHKGMVVENLLEAMEATGVSQERIELVKSIESNCETLKEEVRRFINLCSNIKICTFTETEQTAKVVVKDGNWYRDLNGRSMTAVSKDSALLALPDTIEQKFPAEGDHSTMVKLGSKTHPTYKDVYWTLKDYLGSAATDVAKRFLPAFSALDLYAVGSNISVEFPKFTGRHKEMSQLNDTLVNTSSRKQIVVLQGMGGVGKSCIAVEFAKNNSYTSKWWIDCTSRQTVMASIIEIGQALLEHYIHLAGETEAVRLLGFGGFTTKRQIRVDETDEDRFILATLRWFQRTENRNWLLVLDNADEYETFDHRLCLTGCNHGAILITSRVEAMKSFASQSISVDEMPEDDSIKLFRAHSQRSSP
ncbi:hypothetical protein EX30DRAFT_395307 [Ascodesmis nigricans]|uniref:Orc1-like AAA ATPase domain-containing protein n=1 Tax=Ascodesmis nigricans TaxID=341454 RepID=A0A4S2MZ78_9PEZI|nr:hypothetical protein EX30DRAFT_395307 [Ascodesmis nigricans]